MFLLGIYIKFICFRIFVVGLVGRLQARESVVGSVLSLEQKGLLGEEGFEALLKGRHMGFLASLGELMPCLGVPHRACFASGLSHHLSGGFEPLHASAGCPSRAS